MKQFRVGIIGASVFGRDLGLYLLEDPNVKSICYFDDVAEKSPLEQCDFFGGTDKIGDYYKKSVDKIILGIGYNFLEEKNKLFDRLKTKFEFYTFVHSSCVLAPGASVGDGAILFPGCILDTNASVGENSILHIGVRLAHDSIIEPNSFCAPSVSISGNSKIGSRCFVGINTTVMNSIDICDDVRIGAGSLITQNIEESGLYVGGHSGKVRKLK